jgi:serine/threonine-protein kinase RsbW
VPETRILALVAQHHYDPDATFAIKLSLEEALTNAIKHGNCNNPHKYVTIRYYVDGERAVVMVRDEGCGFVLDEIPDPTADENLERPSGRGLMLIQSYMTHVEFRNPGNEVWMLKLRQSGKP